MQRNLPKLQWKADRPQVGYGLNVSTPSSPQASSQTAFGKWAMCGLILRTRFLAGSCRGQGFEVDWTRAGLLAVDMPNFGSNPACVIAQMLIEWSPDVARYYVPRIDDAVPSARRLLEAFRSAAREVVFTRHGA